MEHNKSVFSDVISTWWKQSSGPCLFPNTGGCDADNSVAKPAHVLLAGCRQAKLSDEWQYFSRRKCGVVIWRRISPRRRGAVFSASFLSYFFFFFLLTNSKWLPVFKHITETLVVLIRTSPSHQMQEEFVTQMWLKLLACFTRSSPAGETWDFQLFVCEASCDHGTW